MRFFYAGLYGLGKIRDEFHRLDKSGWVDAYIAIAWAVAVVMLGASGGF